MNEQNLRAWAIRLGIGVALWGGFRAFALASENQLASLGVLVFAVAAALLVANEAGKGPERADE